VRAAQKQSRRARLHTLRLTERELNLLIADFQGALDVGADENEPAWRTLFEKAKNAQVRASAATEQGDAA
jgi:hypothetical protein